MEYADRDTDCESTRIIFKKMATENILTGRFSTTTIKELNEAVRSLKASLADLTLAGKQGTDEWNRTAAALNETYAQQRDVAKQVTDAAKGLNNAEEGSIANLRQKVSLLNQERNMLQIGSDRYNELTNQLREYNDALRVAGTSAGDMRANVGNYAESMKEALGAMGNEFPALAKGVNGLKASFTALSANPLLVVVQLMVTAFKALQEGFAGNEEASNKMASLWSQLKSPLQALKAALVEFASVIVSAFEAVMPALQKVFSWIRTAVAEVVGVYQSAAMALSKAASFVGLDKVATTLNNVAEGMGKAKTYVQEFGNSMDAASAAAIKLAEAQERLSVTQRRYNEQVASNQSRIEELNYMIERAKQEKEYGAALELNAEKERLVRENSERALSIAREELEIAKANIASGDRSKEALDAESAAKVKVIQATTDLNKALREATTQRTELRNSQAAYVKSLDDGVKAALSFAEAQLAAIEDADVKAKASEVAESIRQIKAAYDETRGQLAEEGEGNVLSGWLSSESITAYFDRVRGIYEAEYEAYAAMVDAQIAKLRERQEAEELSGNSAKGVIEEIAKLTKSKNAEYTKMTKSKEAADKEQSAMLRAQWQKNTSAVGDAIGDMSNLFEQNTIAYKVTAIAKALIDTFLAVANVIAEQPGGMISKLAAAAAIASAGIAAVVKIKNVAVGSTSTSGASAGVGAITSAASTSGAVVSGNIVTDTSPYSYTRTLQTEAEEEAASAPIYVSVTDIDAAQRRVSVRDRESRF